MPALDKAARALDMRLTLVRNWSVDRPPRGWLRAIRDALGLTTKQLAARIGVSQPRVVALEKGEAGARYHAVAEEGVAMRAMGTEDPVIWPERRAHTRGHGLLSLIRMPDGLPVLAGVGHQGGLELAAQRHPREQVKDKRGVDRHSHSPFHVYGHRRRKTRVT